MAAANNDLLREARVLITGGAGFVGSHVVDHVLRAGPREVVVLDDLSRGSIANLRDASADRRLTIYQADIRDRSEVAHATARIDVLFHLAALRMTHCAEDPRLAMEVMVDGTFNVLEAAAAAGVKKVVAASSAAIYGSAERLPIAEDHHPYGNTTIYGAAKIFTEALLGSMRGLEYLVLRPFNVYGPRTSIEGAHTEVLVRWLDRISRGLPPVIHGDGNQSMDFVYVDDVARAFVLAATKEVSGEAFNVASGVETTLNELAQALLLVMESPLGIEYGPPRTLAPIARHFADMRKAAEQLGFRAEIPLMEGLRRLVHWWRNQMSARRAL